MRRASGSGFSGTLNLSDTYDAVLDQIFAQRGTPWAELAASSDQQEPHSLRDRLRAVSLVLKALLGRDGYHLVTILHSRDDAVDNRPIAASIDVHSMTYLSSTLSKLTLESRDLSTMAPVRKTEDRTKAAMRVLGMPEAVIDDIFTAVAAIQALLKKDIEAASQHLGVQQDVRYSLVGSQ